MKKITRTRAKSSGAPRALLNRAGDARLGRHLAKHRSQRCRIVLTGGPGGGKTTAADLFRREIGERVVIVPESATLLFTGGFARSAHLVRHDASFFKKIAFGLAELDRMVSEHAGDHNRGDRFNLSPRPTVHESLP